MESAAFASSIRAHSNPHSTNRRGAQRDEWILTLSRIGPIWTDVLLQIGLFPSRQSAQRRINKLEKTGRLRYAGGVSLQGYKRSHVWCNRNIAGRMLRHEVDVMRVFFVYWPHAYALSGSDVDERWKADMELTIGAVDDGRKYMVEIDQGTESYDQVGRRLAAYRDCPHAVLFVTPTPARVHGALRLTDSPRIYVTTLSACLQDPWGRHWRNARGKSGWIVKPGNAAGAAAKPTDS